jgi:hypothetical protein
MKYYKKFTNRYSPNITNFLIVEIDKLSRWKLFFLQKYLL